MKLTASLLTLLFFVGAAFAKDVTTEIKVKGMTCGSCVVTVKKALTGIEGVRSADVSLEKNSATVVYEDTRVTEDQLRQAINKTGFKALPREEKK